MIDGGEAYDRGSGGKMSVMPSQDALGEFQVLASNYPPDYGIASGGTITMSIKSGTQKFHGEALGVRSQRRARCAQLLRQQQRADDAKSRNCATTSSAPTWAVRYSSLTSTTRSKKKTFFFYNEEWRREVNGSRDQSDQDHARGGRSHIGGDVQLRASINPATTVRHQASVRADVRAHVADPAFNAKLGGGWSDCRPTLSRTTRFQPTCWIRTPALQRHQESSRGNQPATTRYTPTGGHLPDHGP